ncbi:hypothetical protein AM493_01420 [Flavobacterium akiainvivens]|uniref:Ig-like domain-containing protein n=1 Tax=Flavobacterium akiainvivens TaxID=1202724 RepID=A0A0M9VGV0_9FLAO|nr:T9SS type B sorting domain-containing protein [Flavobacterium akiainvivens]KOS04850.1 hypothetical protein AM493_01420 [Flavobacterium akiainvivens]SFQ43291.1 gliding motility-associated C-terminal domain-containing protein [Flavobacterium akiainvivens]
MKPLYLYILLFYIHIFCAAGSPVTGTAFSQFTVVNCQVSQAGYPVKGISISDPDEADIFPTQTLQVNVTQTGSYTISTNTVNGITFSKSGSFTQTGLQNVTLHAAGMPLNYGTFSYAVQGCEFERTTYIPDRRYKDSTQQGEDSLGNGGSTARHHRFLYRVFESGNTEEEWLQTNLGSNYNKVGHPDFNPDAEPQSITDLNAFGSLYQWGRYSDGHELMNWVSEAGTGNVAVNQTTATKSVTDTPGHNDMIITQGSQGDWREVSNSALWQGEGGANNPCPCGFRVPLQSEFTLESDANNLQTLNDAFASQFRVVGPSARNYSTGLVESPPGYQSVYWTSAIASINSSNDFHFQNTVYEHNTTRGFAFSVRCIMMSYKFERCDEGYDGQESFNLDEIATQIVADYPGHSVSFYDTFENARLENSSNLLSGSYVAYANQNPNILFARLEDANGNFVNGIKIKFYVYETPAVAQAPTLFYCTTIGSSIGLFNLNEADGLLTDDEAGEIFIRYYSTEAAAQAGEAAGLISNPGGYTGAAGTVYARIENLNGCFVLQQVHLVISAMDITPQHINGIDICGTENTVDLASYIDQFTTTPQNYSIYYYTNQADATANNTANAVAEPQAYSLPSSGQTHTVWINFSLNSGINCGNVISSLTFTINALPQISAAAFTACPGENATLSVTTNGSVVNWYANEADTTPMYTGATFATPQLGETTSYWAEAVSAAGCKSDKIEVTVTVAPFEAFAYTENVAVCSGTAAVLEVVAQPGYTVNWYETETSHVILYSGTVFETPALTAPASYWAELVNATGCASGRVVVNVLIKEVLVPVFTFGTVYCLNDYAPALPATSGNGLSGTWSPASINTSSPGIYTYVFTSNSGDCDNGLQTEIEIEVTQPVVPQFDLATEYFFGEEPSALPDVSVNGIQGYWVSSFTNTVTQHTFYPNDDECATGVFAFTSVGYPSFFTPNGDGNSDYWSLAFLNAYDAIRIKQVYIYDRFGKLLVSLPQNGRWDGTYKGKMLPATDYWFMVEYLHYLSNGTRTEKTAKGHFSLIR